MIFYPNELFFTKTRKNNGFDTSRIPRGSAVPLRLNASKGSFV
jgi:hypothetical protein